MNKAQLTIKGKKEDAYVSMYVLSETCEKYDVPNIGILGNNIINFGFKWLPVVMFEGVKYSYEREGKPFDLKLFNFIDYLDDNGMESEEVINFVEVFSKSIQKHVKVDEGNEKEGDAKKK